jgi:hypothetical protein
MRKRTLFSGLLGLAFIFNASAEDAGMSDEKLAETRRILWAKVAEVDKRGHADKPSFADISFKGIDSPADQLAHLTTLYRNRLVNPETYHRKRAELIQKSQ